MPSYNFGESLEVLNSRRFYVALCAELLGTCLLVFVGCGSCADAETFTLLRTVFCFGFTVASIVVVVGNVSGGHINPAVTFGFFVTRRFNIVRTLLYMFAQIIGSIIGAAILDGVLDEDKKDLRSRHFYVKLVAEALGTSLLVFIGCGSCADPKRFDLIRTALCFTFTVASLCCCIGNVSGCHINPAVTIGFFVTRRFNFVRTVCYMASQASGAIIGALVLHYLIHENSRGTLCTPSIAEGLTTGKAIGVELIISFVLVFVVFSVIDNQRKDVGGSNALTIGLAISMCHLMAIPLTGSSMNPARALGPAVVSNTWDDQWVYWVGPLLGGAFAALMYDFVFAVNATPAKLRGFFRMDYDNDHYNSEGRRADYEDPTNNNICIKL